MSDVGTEKVFENDKVIVWDLILDPGEETPVHTHTHSYMWYAIEGAPLRIYDEHGSDLGIFEVSTGGVYSLLYENGYLEILSSVGNGMRVPATHRARNEGDKRYREILVEYK
jgi:beta-alanine degradation protein BauB